jgi:hypothetical protein
VQPIPNVFLHAFAFFLAVAELLEVLKGTTIPSKLQSESLSMNGSLLGALEASLRFQVNEYERSLF